MTSHTLSRRFVSLSLSLLLGASLLGGFLFFVSATWAAPGNPILDPPRNLTSAPPTTAVSIAYDESIDANTVTSRTFAVHGMQSGLVTGVHGVVNGGRTIIVTPTRPFHQGELVYAIATTGTLNITGTEPQVATQWQFNTGTVNPRCVGGFVEDGTASASLPGVENGSVDWGDYDGDGDLDILLTGWSSDLTARVYQNEGGVFTDVDAGLTGVGWSSAAWGDYDGDGDLDILVTGWGIGSSTVGSLALVYRNDDGAFADIGAGLTGVAWSDVAWGDYDNDGDLDILLTGSDENSNSVALLYENRDGTFIEDTTATEHVVGVEDTGMAWGDYDNDGDLDLLLTGREQSGDTHARLYENEGGAFTDAGAGLTGVLKGSAAWGDYDGDGDLDILLTGSRAAGPTTLLYRNESGNFSEVTDAGLRDVGDGSEGAWGDYDNDGDLDILLTGSDGSTPVALVYENTDTGFVEDVTASTNLVGVRYSSAAWGDYDDDGDLDALLAGEDQNYGRRTALYRNVDCTDVVITKSVTPELVASGGALTYTLTVSNAGPSSMLAPIVVTDTLPDGMSSVNASVECDVSALPLVTCTLSGSLDVGQRQEITITGSAPVTPGVITNSAGAATTLRDVSVSNNSATVTSTVAHMVDLEVVKRGPDSIDPSGSLTYTVVITNHGPNPALGAVVTDSIRNGVLGGYDFDSDWSCSIESPGTFSNSITCASGGTIDPGGTETIRFRAQAPETGGTITNTVTVRDGENADRWLSNNSSVYTTHVNFPPTITVPFEAYETDENVTEAITFTVGDMETPLDSLTLTPDVADATLIEDITFGGTGADRTASITPTPDAHGSTVITFTVGDEDGLSDSDAFTLTVNPVNDAPTITVPFEAYETDEDVTRTIAFTVGDIDTPLEDLTLTGNVADTTLIPTGNVTFSGTGVDRTATVTPAADAYGSTVITFTVSDGELSDSDAFTLTVNEVNDPPTARDDGVTVTEDSGPTGIDVLGNDAAEPDEDGPLSIQAVGAASNGTTAAGGGMVTYAPDADFAGMDAFTYTVADARGLTATATVAVTVTEVNDWPTITVPMESYETDEDVSKAITFTVGDVETALTDLILTSEASSASLVADVSFEVGAGGSSTATVTPTADAYGTTVITLTVEDEGGLDASDAFTLTVNEVNDPPTALDDGVTVMEDSGPTGIDVLENDTADPDDDGPPSLWDVGAASNGTTAWGGGVVTYTPDADFSGSDAFTYTVEDTRGLTATATVAVTVTEVNDWPTITVPYEAYWIDEDVPAVITFTVDDVETASLDLTLTSEASSASLVADVSFEVDASGSSTATVTPAADAYGTTMITLTVTDEGDLDASDAFTLTVNEVNDPPTALDDGVTVAEDSGPTRIDVLANDTADPDDDGPLSLWDVGAASNGTTAWGGGVVTYTPDANFAGSDAFTYTVEDTRGLTATATVALTVTEVNDPPTITVPYEDYVSEEDATAVLTFTVGDVETAPGGLTLAAESSDLALMASVDFSGTGEDRTATIEPLANAYGTAVITFTVRDGGGLSGSDAFTLTVSEVNDRPTAVDDGVTVLEDSGPTGIDVLGNDTATPDDDGPLNLWDVGSASSGTTAWGSGIVTYTPDAHFAGSDAFTYTVEDTRGLTATATVAVTVTEENDPPTITVPYEDYVSEEDATAVITFTVGDVETAPGGLTLAAESSDLDLMASVDFSGTGENRAATIEPLANAYGTAVITFTVSDGGGLSASDAFTLTVNEVNDPPTAADDTATVAEDSADNEIRVLLNDSTAPDVGETMSVEAVGPAANGEVWISAAQIVIYTPHADFVGADTFRYTMTDGRGLTATATVTVTVAEEPEAPSLSVPAKIYTTDEDVVASVPFVVGDGDTPLGDLSVTAEASDSGLIPPGSVVFSGTGADRMAEIAPAANAHGTTVITFTVSDEALSGSDAFTLTVVPVNDPPAFGSEPVKLAAADEPYAYAITATDPDAGDVLEIVGPVLPSWLTLSDNGDGTAFLSGTPTTAHVSDHDVELRVRDDGGLVDLQTFVITVQPTIYRLYLPLVARNYVAAPDLIVESLVATSSGVTVTIKNAGSAAIEELFTNEFWVDVYVDPDVPPTEVNQTWEMVGSEGLAWGVTVDALPLAPGDTLTLVSHGLYYRPDESEVSWPLTPGTPVYAQVDSAHVETAHGTVWEIHEITGGAYNNIFGPAAVTSVDGERVPVLEVSRPSVDSHLPPRPRGTYNGNLVE